jgi:NAD(P)-dependent dehydrogenase (short-subunit alcohol dehydrogenase family)
VGFIVNFSSQAGRRKSELGNLRYFAATAGILGFTRQLVRQLDHIVVYAEQIDQTARLELSEPRIFKRLSRLGDRLKIGD